MTPVVKVASGSPCNPIGKVARHTPDYVAPLIPENVACDFCDLMHNPRGSSTLT